MRLGRIGIVIFITALVFWQQNRDFPGFKILAVTSGSMEPALPVGSLVFVRKIDSPKVGDIITFWLGNDLKNLVTHRMIEIREVKGQMMYQTKGDAVGQPDIELVPFERIVGKVMFSIPFIGYPIAFGKTQMGIVMLVVIPAAIIVYEEFKSIWKEIKKVRSHPKKSKTK